MKKSWHGRAPRLDGSRPLSRRTALKGAGALAGAAAAASLPGWTVFAQSGSDAPLRLGFQVHRTGIGAAYGRWYERTSQAAVKHINDIGGIAGRPVELVIEDDGTDPKRGAEVVEKFANQHKVDFVFGTLFSHVVVGSAPTAGELKMPYFVVSEGYHVASGGLNRYVFQPGITDVRQQVISMAPWVTANLGKKITMIFPDYAFGHDHRDYFSAAAAAPGRRDPPAAADSADRDLLHQILSPDPAGYRGDLSRDGRARRAHLRQGNGRVLRQQPARAVRLHRLARGRRHREPRPGIPRWLVFLGGLSALRRWLPDPCRALLPRAGRRERGRRERERSEGRLDVLPHVRLLGDALRHQARGRAERLSERERAGQGGADRDAGELTSGSKRASSTPRAARCSSARSTSASGSSSSRGSRTAG